MITFHILSKRLLQERDAREVSLIKIHKVFNPNLGGKCIFLPPDGFPLINRKQ